MNTYYWLIKREFWENRGSFLWAPVVATGVLLLLTVMAIITFEVFAAHFNINIGGMNIDQLVKSLNQNNLPLAGKLIDEFMLLPLSLLYVVLSFVVFFYSLGSLYDDRRDRSILFWKSLPISDRNTVFSKVISATVIAPVIATVCGLIGGIGMLLLVMLEASIHGVHLWSMLGYTHPLRTLWIMLAILPVNFVWALPTIGWLMLCSAWARSKPFLWAVAVPVTVGIMVMWFRVMNTFSLSGSWFWEHVVARSLLSVYPGGWIVSQRVGIPGSETHNITLGSNLGNIVSVGNAWSQLLSTDFLVGAAAGLAMITLAIWFRRRRDDA